jgi:replicative DNA helicase
MFPPDTNTDPAAKLPPHSIDAEMALIGSLCLLGNDPDVAATWARVRDIVRPIDLFSDDHRIMFNHLLRLHEGGKPIDSVLLRESLAGANVLEEIGGTIYLTEVLASVGSAMHAERYAEIVADRAARRQVIQIATDAQRDAQDGLVESGTDLLQRLASRVADAAEKRTTTGRSRLVVDIAADLLDDLDNGRRPAMVGTGFAELDDLLGGGIELGENVVVGGRPSMGKSVFARQLAWHAATAGVPALIVSLEERGTLLTRKLLAAWSGVSAGRLRRGRDAITTDDRARLGRAVEELRDLKLWASDTARTPEQITATVSSAVHRDGV